MPASILARAGNDSCACCWLDALELQSAATAIAALLRVSTSSSSCTMNRSTPCTKLVRRLTVTPITTEGGRWKVAYQVVNTLHVEWVLARDRCQQHQALVPQRRIARLQHIGHNLEHAYSQKIKHSSY